MQPISNTKSSLRKQGFWLSVLLLLTCCVYAADDKTEPPQEQPSAGVWAKAVGEYYAADNVTTEEARQKALQDARQNAIQEVVGIRVRAQTLLFETETLQDSQESFVEMSQSNIYGYIIEEKDPVWHPVESIELRPGDPQIPLHSVTLEANF
jgi:hypothetical protein